MTRALFAVVSLLSTCAVAQVYTWTDSAGVTHYSNDPQAIPKNAKLQEGDGPVLQLDPQPRAEKSSDDGKAAAAMWAQSFVSAHNSARVAAATTGGLDPLEWDDTAARVAAKLANTCKFTASDAKAAGSRNTAWSVSELTPVDVVRRWAEDQKDLDQSRRACRADRDCAHYLRLVSPNHRAVGCAHAHCGSNSPSPTSELWHNWVCVYVGAPTAQDRASGNPR